MIDLDQAPRYRQVARRGRLPRALALLVAGTLLGGVATYLWWYRPLAASAEQAARADNAAVRVLLFAQSGTTTRRGDQQVHLDAQVTVVNAGPVTLDVLAVRADQPGVTVRSPEKERQVEPGTSAAMDVTIEWTCGAGEPASLAASVSVETADEQLRTITPVAIHAEPWIEDKQEACFRD
ncbi:hypothetical protein [Actinoplanes sp. OR16]|uniref:hypothetical protein n=1 Tax=Actinoplanes sp. OR16 TaxID=946334 RepID=UPI000FDB65E4|nr:hypothetical protein [Actinoplanes sp. OR16]